MMLLNQPTAKDSCPDQLPFWVTLNSSQFLQDTVKFYLCQCHSHTCCHAVKQLLRSTPCQAVPEERGTVPMFEYISFAKCVRIFCD